MLIAQTLPSLLRAFILVDFLTLTVNKFLNLISLYFITQQVHWKQICWENSFLKHLRSFSRSSRSLEFKAIAQKCSATVLALSIHCPFLRIKRDQQQPVQQKPSQQTQQPSQALQQVQQQQQLHQQAQTTSQLLGKAVLEAIWMVK